MLSRALLSFCVIAALTSPCSAEHPLKKSLLLHASFDGSPDADFAKGDAKIYTAESLKRDKVTAGLKSDAVRQESDKGRFGGCLTFTKKSPKIVFYRGLNNLPNAQSSLQGTYSFWLKLSPKDDLPPGYVDPLQITDKKWNDASFFVDFTKETPRKFRLGVFSDFKFWNSKNRKWEEIPDGERPLVTVDRPPFRREAWTHVGITFRGFNRPKTPAQATLYLDGEKQGELKREQHFTWGGEKLAIMLGINYVGGFDDLAIFDRPLSPAELKQLLDLPDGVKSLR